jgi:ribonuclease T
MLADIDFDNKEAHSAAYDTWKTAELFCYIVNRWKELGGWPLKEHNDNVEESFADMFK